MRPLLSQLSRDEVETLLQLCDELPSYKAVSAYARDNLGFLISPSSLCRLYTRHRIAEDQLTRSDYADAALTESDKLLTLAENQLQLRLLELASRPNPGASELGALFQIITRLQSLALAERRVVVAEKREARMQQQAGAQTQNETRCFSPEQAREGVRVLFGKPPEEEAPINDDQHPAPSDASPQSDASCHPLRPAIQNSGLSRLSLQHSKLT